MAAPPRPTKVLIVGPSRSHKSCLANFLTGARDALDGYSPGPTVGARLLEAPSSPAGPLEVWDVSSDAAYEATWPALRDGADGVLVVWDPSAPGAAAEAELFFGWFVTGAAGVGVERAAALAVTAPGAAPAAPAPHLGGLPVETAVLAGGDEGGPEGGGGGGGDAARRAWTRLLTRLAKRGPRGGGGGA